MTKPEQAGTWTLYIIIVWLTFMLNTLLFQFPSIGSNIYRLNRKLLTDGRTYYGTDRRPGQERKKRSSGVQKPLKINMCFILDRLIVIDGATSENILSDERIMQTKLRMCTLVFVCTGRTYIYFYHLDTDYCAIKRYFRRHYFLKSWTDCMCNKWHQKLPKIAFKIWKISHFLKWLHLSKTV